MNQRVFTVGVTAAAYTTDIGTKSRLLGVGIPTITTGNDADAQDSKPKCCGVERYTYILSRVNFRFLLVVCNSTEAV